MKISKQKAIEILGCFPECLNRLNKIKDEFVFIDIMPKEQYKTRKQNNLFHALLTCFWASGCSSFGDYDELRRYYKRIAGLIKRNGDIVNEGSWAEVSKDNAKLVIDMLLHDMDFAGVIGSSQGRKYESILRGIGEFMEEIR